MSATSHLGSATLDEPAMLALAAALSPRLRPGDCVLLEGEVGAGKTSFARAVIRAACGADMEVTSPTFTLLQTYPASAAEIWHLDLYRLERPSDLAALGLEEGLRHAITLIEWPALAAPLLPADALRLQFSGTGASRRLDFSSAMPQHWHTTLQGVL